MKSKLILDSQMRASSSKFYTSGANNARKDLTAIPGVRDGGWIAADHDGNPWLQVDFILNVTVSKWYIQGLAGKDHIVTKYTIASGDDGETFSDYKPKNQQTAKVNRKLNLITVSQGVCTCRWLSLICSVQPVVLLVIPGFYLVIIVIMIKPWSSTTSVLEKLRLCNRFSVIFMIFNQKV